MKAQLKLHDDPLCKRIYNDFLTKQALASQSSASSLDSYYSQISQINNMVADTKAGLSPALQDFFAAVQNLASNPNTQASRQSVLSQASTLVARVSRCYPRKLDELGRRPRSIHAPVAVVATHRVCVRKEEVDQVEPELVEAEWGKSF